MPRLICSTEIPYPIESCVLKIHRNLLGKISQNQLLKVLCAAFFVICICNLFKTQAQYLTSYLLFNERYELKIFKMQNGWKLPNECLINAYISTPLAVHVLCGMAGFLSHLSSCDCLSCIRITENNAQMERCLHTFMAA